MVCQIMQDGRAELCGGTGETNLRCVPVGSGQVGSWVAIGTEYQVCTTEYPMIIGGRGVSSVT
jgi:hypothetical protein